ncbi:hypothetical protein BOTBODRAFT_30450 [Botryobasidium botryosum FD-172 SS1]|uniref:F-box domain-containing protein n=1 Tax=Botryobasidium botryosum (strain FD-172 SS1) TaxID=930990 RepID=A0A067MZV3_BOTB1|nr:hypothetical protein BOTBODRAFT_30450 [Botryobasidium botryosum FD-172 SS1]
MTVALINRLPTEILSHIFQSCQYRGWGDLAVLILFPISRVCRLWREVIQGCPALWSDIYVRASSRRAEAQAAYQLERAGSTLLSIGIQFYWRDEYKWTEEEVAAADARPLQLADALRDTMPRWQSFRMEFSQPHDIQSFLDNCVGYTPNLSDISIGAHNDSGLPTLFIPFLRPESGPPVVASFVNVFPVFSSLGANVTELNFRVEYHLEQPLTVDFIDVLSSCPNLALCHLQVRTGLAMSDMSASSVVSLPRLANLTVIGFRDPEHLLGALRADALRRLYFHAPHYSPALRSVLQRIFRACPLLTAVGIAGSVRVVDEPSIPGPLTSEWTSSPSVTYFCLEFMDPVAHPFLRQLSLPQAQVLEIRNTICDVAYTLMSSSIHLASVSLSNLFGAPPQHMHILALPNLLSIKFEGRLDLLRCISAPNLSELSLSLHNPASSSHPTLMRGFIERSHPPLRILHLNDKQFADEDIIWCLQRLPLIEELGVAYTPMSDVTLRALEAPPLSQQGTDADVLLPRLRLANFTETCTTAEGFATLAASRNTVTWKHHPRKATGSAPAIANQ